MDNHFQPRSSISFYAAFGSSLFIGVLIGWLIYTQFLHPLAAIPGPFLASLTKLWYIRQLQKGDFPAFNRRLHRIYGPVVRISPTQVSVSDATATTMIYGARSKFTKTDFYTAWKNPKFETKHTELFADVDEAHALSRKRIVLPIYSTSIVLENEAAIDTHINKMLNKFSFMAESMETFDLNLWLEFFALDALGSIFFSTNFGHLDSGSDINGWVTALEYLIPINTIVPSLPAYLRTLYVVPWLLISPAVRNAIKNANKLVKMVAQLTLDRQKLIHQAVSAPNAETDLLSKCLRIHNDRGNLLDWTIADVQNEGYITMFAGSDTTSIAMVSIMYNLLTHPDALGTLLIELEEALADGRLTLPVRFADAIKLPYFVACVKEGFRLHPSVALPMWRHVPLGGCDIAGHYIPEGFEVGINAAVSHYDRNVFGEYADEFNPQRWLTNDAADMDKYMLHFGGGLRSCLGKNIPLVEIHKLLPHLLLDFNFELTETEKPLGSSGMWFNKQHPLIVKARRRQLS